MIKLIAKIFKTIVNNVSWNCVFELLSITSIIFLIIIFIRYVLKLKKTNDIAFGVLKLIFLIFILIITLSITITIILKPDIDTSNWLGYFGSMISAFIGFMASMLVMALNFEKDKIKDDKKELEKNKPYLYAVEAKTIEQSESIHLKFKLTNIGVASATNLKIEYLENNKANLISQSFETSDNSTTPYLIQEKKNINIILNFKNLNQTENLKISYSDILGNQYEQNIQYILDPNKYGIKDGYFVCEPPILIKPSNSKHS